VNSIFLALEQLHTQLSQALPATPGLRHFDVSFPLNDAFDPLAWLGEQQCYPQFYWQQRNGDEELAALGAVTQFSSLALASQFCVQNMRQKRRASAASTHSARSMAVFFCRACSGDVPLATPPCACSCGAIARFRTTRALPWNYSSNSVQPEPFVRCLSRLSAKRTCRKNRNG